MSFEAWFEHSKVVDAAGNPLVVYHGTCSDICAFDPEYIGSGNGCSDWGDGFYFASKAHAANQYAMGEGGNVMPVYLRITNPASLDTMLLPEIQDALDDGMGFVTVAEALGKLGHDGIIIDHGEHGLELVVFDPRQIKSAIGNSGRYDPHSDSLVDRTEEEEQEEEAHAIRERIAA